MKKQRGRVITGWRQVAAAKTTPSARRTSATAAKVAAPTEPPPKQQWETEGGNIPKVATRANALKEEKT